MQVKNIDIKMRLSGDYELILTVPKKEQKAVLKLMEDFKAKADKEWQAEISVKKKKRSLDANGKAWLLLGQIAEELSKETPISAEEIYKRMIPDISKGEIIPIRNEAVETWIYNWEHKPSTKIGWISKSLGKSKIEGYTNTINWFGSSCFDTIEMSKLLNLIVQECNQLGIETLSPDELERLVQMHGQ
jgi:hypothetical protein